VVRPKQQIGTNPGDVQSTTKSHYELYEDKTNRPIIDRSKNDTNDSLPGQ
jgi:hypothetical protein